MKGIILAGGTGSRMHPLTEPISKQLLPVYDKPLIYYPLSTLILAGIKEILIITTPYDLARFKHLLGDGSSLGIKLLYKTQDEPRGIAEAFIIAEDFIETDNICLILGDNIFYGQGLKPLLTSAKKTVEEENKAFVFGYYVSDPERYGVAEFNEHMDILSITEKPKLAKSNYAVTGLYFYPDDIVEVAKQIIPSARNELEITDVNNLYIQESRLKLQKLSRGFAWLDSGTPDSMLDAARFVQTIEHRQGLKIACIEEIAYKMGYISKDELLKKANTLNKSQYGQYLEKIVTF